MARRVDPCPIAAYNSEPSHLLAHGSSWLTSNLPAREASRVAGSANAGSRRMASARSAWAYLVFPRALIGPTASEVDFGPGRSEPACFLQVGDGSADISRDRMRQPAKVVYLGIALGDSQGFIQIVQSLSISPPPKISLSTTTASSQLIRVVSERLGTVVDRLGKLAQKQVRLSLMQPHFRVARV